MIPMFLKRTTYKLLYNMYDIYYLAQKLYYYNYKYYK